jgi:hypothetical protein|tara:strand:+ start:439 stop:1599 length:1161 start_codon:yes stop_codon:yes gene_type:complete
MLKLVEGKVTSNVDASKSGRFYAHFYEISDEPILVYYSAPGYREGGGGIFAVPERDDHIIAVYNTIQGHAYYNSTIVGLPFTSTKKAPDLNPVPDVNTYTVHNKPVKVKYENQKGAGLCITSEHTSFPELNDPLSQGIMGSEGPIIPPRIIESVALKSNLNKRLSLDDSPQTDAIFIKNQHKDGIIISGDSTKLFPAQMIQVKSSGPHNYTCMQSHMDIRVVEGTDITIENNSTGKMSASSIPQDQWPNEGIAPKRYGGIYLKSDNGDVSLVSKSNQGKIFINTPHGQVQIAEGNIIINTNGNLQMAAGGDIEMTANGSIKLDAGANVDINSGAQLRTQSVDNTSISSGGLGQVIVNGSLIHLNGVPATPPGNPGVVAPLLNDYGD